MHTAAESCRLIAELGLWKRLEPFNFAIRPQGMAIPYFCTVLCGNGVKARMLLLEGWQTMHDYVRLRLDRNFGFYQTPAEMPHFELVAYEDGGVKLFRHDPGYVPRVLAEGDPREALVAKLLWQAYGVMLRVESEGQLPLRFVEEKAVFARVETSPEKWEDRPLEIPDPQPHVENVRLLKEDITSAKDLPIVTEQAINLDFRLEPHLSTTESRPRTVYRLVAADAKTGEKAIDCTVTIGAEGGLRGLWQDMPSQVLKALIRRGRIPGEIRVQSGRVFRMLRALCLELPLKLSLHDSVGL